MMHFGNGDKLNYSVLLLWQLLIWCMWYTSSITSLLILTWSGSLPAALRLPAGSCCSTCDMLRCVHFIIWLTNCTEPEDVIVFCLFVRLSLSPLDQSIKKLWINFGELSCVGGARSNTEWLDPRGNRALFFTILPPPPCNSFLVT